MTMNETNASELIDQRISELGGWRGTTLGKVRGIIREADPDVVEEWKWVKPTNPGVPVWSHDGIICTGEVYKSVVKLTFAKGAQLKDPKKLFNSSLEGKVRRALDIHEGDTIDEAAFTALIREAVAAIPDVVAVSPLYETDPVGGPEQGAFLNLVVELDTEMSPRELLELCQELESNAHRMRLERWGPRTLDVDVITVDEQISDNPALTLPHPRAAERAFVLVPWLVLEPGATLPGRGPVASLLAAIPVAEVEQIVLIPEAVLHA